MARMVGVIVDGTRYRSINQACRAHGVDIHLVHGRLRNGWDIERSITTPKMRESSVIDLEGHLYMSLKDVAREFGINYETLYSRIQKGMSLLDAITTPVEEPRCRNGNCKITCVDGVYYDSIKEAAEAHGVDPYLVRIRIHKGWDKEKAFKTPRKSRRI